jgi:O-antigen ligase
LAALGKDRSLTGRTDIWKASIKAIQAHPTLGYGWGGVFSGGDLEPTYTIQRSTGFPAAHAHNAVLMMLLQLGIVGLILATIMIFAVLRHGLRSVFQGDMGEGFLFLAIPLVLIVAGIAEPTFSAMGIAWCAFLLPLILHQDRAQRLRASSRIVTTERHRRTKPAPVSAR